MSAQLSATKPKIKILLYTDDPEIAPTEDSSKFFGLGSMMARLHAHAPAFADLETTWMSRSSDLSKPVDNRINDVLQREVDNTGEHFDEIWFFGMQQANSEKFSQTGLRGGPDSELDDKEVQALAAWMGGSVGGGVLMTGDHSNGTPPKRIPNPNSPCADDSANATFLGLGRAIGRCVPRAGQLRKWEGPPTSDSKNSNNTIAGEGLQTDPRPQILHLENVNADGDPDPSGQPHPLFFYRPDQFIKVFPDHAHEGELILPANVDDEVWRGIRPRAVAISTNSRNNEPLHAVVTYNGDRAGFGRIVADSTWHHYMNLNLTGFPHPAPEGSESDQIGQFYANLAVWLAPLRKRQQMAQAMFWELARYTFLVEPGKDAAALGQVAYSVLSKVACRCEIHELLQVSAPKKQNVLHAMKAELGFDHETAQTLALGHVLDSYHRTMSQAETVDDAKELAPLEVDKLIDAAFTTTFETQKARLQRTLDLLSAAEAEA